VGSATPYNPDIETGTKKLAFPVARSRYDSRDRAA
jgi:hypothetical protein